MPKGLSYIAVGVVAGAALAGASHGVLKAATAAGNTGVPLFAEVFDKVRSNYAEKPDDDKLVRGAIDGMLASLDPHSTYFDPKALEDFQSSMKGEEFGGLGLEVMMEDGLVKVVSPIDDTPAARAGLLSGDLITQIDDTPVKGLTLKEAVDKMRVGSCMTAWTRPWQIFLSMPPAALPPRPRELIAPAARARRSSIAGSKPCRKPPAASASTRGCPSRLMRTAAWKLTCIAPKRIWRWNWTGRSTWRISRPTAATAGRMLCCRKMVAWYYASWWRMPADTWMRCSMPFSAHWRGDRAEIESRLGQNLAPAKRADDGS